MKQWGPEYVNSLIRDAEEVGVDLTDEMAAKLVAHLDLVIEKNKQLNLTRIEDEVTALRLHIVDSLSVVPEVTLSPDGPLCDLGTGAGFPGIPVAIVTGRECLLVESVKKKANAVSEFVEHLELDGVTVFPGRAEELALQSAGVFACCVARALTSLPSLLELASPLLMSGGRLIAMKARPDETELEAARTAASLVGMEAVGTRRFTLPGGDDVRTFFVYEKKGASRIPLPRRSGMAQRQPLA